MPVTNDNYDQIKIDKLKHYLEAQAAKGQPVPFEIFVDNLKAVPRTEDAKEFENYEYYMNEDTEKVRIIIYTYGLSPRNDQYSFHVQKNKVDKSQNGLGEIETIVQEKLAARDREHELTNLREELETTKQELEEADAECEKLEKEIEYLKANKFKLKNIDLGDLASLVAEGFVRRNTHLLKNLPGGEALAGILIQDNQDQQNRMAQTIPPSEGEATFKCKEKTTPQVSDEEIRQLAYLAQILEHFDQQEVDVFNRVLSKMAEEPAKLKEVAAVFNIHS